MQPQGAGLGFLAFRTPGGKGKAKHEGKGRGKGWERREGKGKEVREKGQSKDQDWLYGSFLDCFEDRKAPKGQKGGVSFGTPREKGHKGKSREVGRWVAFY